MQCLSPNLYAQTFIAVLITKTRRFDAFNTYLHIATRVFIAMLITRRDLHLAVQLPISK